MFACFLGSTESADETLIQICSGLLCFFKSESYSQYLECLMFVSWLGTPI